MLLSPCPLSLPYPLLPSFDLLGNRSDASFSLLPELSEERITLAALSANALVAVTTSPDGLPSVHVVDGLTSPEPRVLPETGLPPGSRGPTCIALIDGSLTSHGRAEVLLGHSDATIIVLDAGGEDEPGVVSLSTPPLSITVSFTGDAIALFGENGTLSAWNTNFSQQFVEFDTKAEEAPSQVVFCGDSAIALAWGSGILIVGPHSEDLRLEFDGEDAIVLVGELDGLRVLGVNTHEFVQQVPDALAALHGIVSSAPSATLLDAATSFSEGDALCDDLIRDLCAGDDSVRPPIPPGATLARAVQGCMDAALAEWDTEEQRKLLRAAAYGKAFNPSAFSREAFPMTCYRLRVLNALRDSDVGLPLTAPQLETLSPAVVIDRLLARHNHRLALSLASYLSLPASRDKALVHWACAKVKASRGVSDEALAHVITRRLTRVAAVSYADIAAAADAAGRRLLATLLLDHEPRAADRVPILLRMRERRLALEKALEAGDTDLVHLALSHLRRACAAEGAAGVGLGGGEGMAGAGAGSEGDGGAGAISAVAGPLDPDDEDAAFIRVVLGYPAAADLLAEWASTSDPPLLLKLRLAGGKWGDAGRAAVRIAFARGSGGGEGSDLRSRIAGLRKAGDTFREGEKAPKASAAERADAAFFARATDEAAALVQAQVALERELREAGVKPVPTLVDTTLSATLLALLGVGGEPWGKRAEKLCKEFGVSDSTWTHLRVRALASGRDWGGLWELANARKSPIGYAPFVKACEGAGAFAEAKRYVVVEGGEGRNRYGLLKK